MNHTEDAEERREDADEGFLRVLTRFLRLLRVIVFPGSTPKPSIQARRTRPTREGEAPFGDA
jgi:hypothetical protein